MENYNQPRFLRLKTGEDIICECAEVSSTKDNVTRLDVKNPLKVLYMPSNMPGLYHVGLTPWLFDNITNVTTVNISTDDVLFDVGVTDRMTDHYWKTIDASHKNGSDMELLTEGEMNGEMDEEVDEEEFDEMMNLHPGNRTYH